MNEIDLGIVTSGSVGWKTVRTRWEEDLADFSPTLHHIEDHARLLAGVTERYGAKSVGHAVAGRAAIPNLHPGDLDGADPRLDRPHWAVAVPHEAIAAVGKLQALHRSEKRLGFHLDSLRKQLPRTRS